jgi:hypothetical protein
MKSSFGKTIKICLLAAMFAGNPAKAQVEELTLLYGPVSDASVLLQEYLRPYMNILGANLNAGWYNTARPHKLGGIDVTGMASVAFAPPSALQYDLASVSGLIAEVQGNTVAPTVAGEMVERPQLIYTKDIQNAMGQTQTVSLPAISHPNGSGFDFLILPIGQLSLGLPFGTEVTARYIPTINLRDQGEIGLWGVGGKHSISQWIPILKRLKFIDIAVQGGYTKVSSTIHLGLEPQDGLIAPENAPLYWNDQFLTTNIQGWTVNLIASQTIPVLTLYQGIGYSSSVGEIVLTGSYPLTDVVTDTENPDFGSATYRIVKDPIPEGELSFENYRNLRINAGMRIKLGVFTIHYDFTRTLYSTHTAGIGFTFR